MRSYTGIEVLHLCDFFYFLLFGGTSYFLLYQAVHSSFAFCRASFAVSSALYLFFIIIFFSFFFLFK